MTIYNDKAFKAEYSVSVWILKAEKSTCNEYRNMWGESVCDDNGSDYLMFGKSFTSLADAMQVFLNQKMLGYGTTLMIDYIYNNTCIGTEIIEESKINITRFADEELKAENKQLKKQIEIQNTCIEELKPFMNLSKEHKKDVMEYINGCEEV
jgi:hypothetical protein